MVQTAASAKKTQAGQGGYNPFVTVRQQVDKCAQILKRIDSYIDDKGINRGTKLNLVFYLAMYATCAALKSVKPARARIASLDISLLTDPLLDGCYAWLTEAFTQLGGDDKASKGPSLIAALKLKIIEEYGKKTST